MLPRCAVHSVLRCFSFGYPERSVHTLATHVRNTRRKLLAGLRYGSLATLVVREWGVGAGSFIFMVAFFVSAVLGVVRQILLNYQFGVTLEASAYSAAARLPESIGVLITGGSLANAMVPVLLHVIRTESEEAGRLLINLILTTFSIIMAVAVVVGIIIAPYFVRHMLAPGFDAYTSHLTIALTRILLLELLIGAASSVASAVLISRNQFVLPALALALRNITLICGILAAIRFPALGIYGPTIGALGDGVLVFCILVPGLYRCGFRYQPLWQPANRHLRKVVRLLIPNGLSASVNYAGTIVDTAFASMVNQHGALPALDNAFRLVGLPIRLLGMAVGQAAFPHLSAHAVAGEWQQMRRTLFWSLGLAMGVGVLVALGMVVLGRPVIRILFEHGQFDAAAGTLTYTLMVGFAIALPAYIGTEILTRGLYALYDTLTPLLTNALQLAGRFVMIALLLDTMGVIIIPLAFALTSTLETILLGIVLLVKLQRRMKRGRNGVEREDG